MNNEKANMQMIRKLMFRLLPVQILSAMVGAINGLVSSYFASNYVGVNAMSAVGLYGPLGTLTGALSTLICAGCAMVCGKYLVQNDRKTLQDVFSFGLTMSVILAVVMTGLYLLLGLFDLTFIFTTDPSLRPALNRYLLGQATGLLPLTVGNLLPVFLSMENQNQRNMTASLIYIAVNLVVSFLFIKVLRFEEMGLAMASSIGMWVYTAVQLQYYLTGKSLVKISYRPLDISRVKEILDNGQSNAAGALYMTVRGMIVNNLLSTYAGASGVSAFAAANNVMNIFWAVPAGMLAVSRLLISVCVGEQDRQTLANIMKVMLRYYLPVMAAVDAGIILMAGPLAGLFFDGDTAEALSIMTQCLKILPLCMPFSIIVMHFTCYAQAAGMGTYDNVFTFLDGALCVSLFSLILAPLYQTEGVCWANVINGLICLAGIIGYSWVKNRHFPRKVDELMVIPESFGVSEEDRIDVSVKEMSEVMMVSEKVREFCLSKGIDRRRTNLAGLSLEEMAGNVVDHGFRKDKRDHTVDIRVIYIDSDGSLLLRIRDDCVPFNPEDRSKIIDPEDPAKNVGIRMIYGIMNDITYQNILGLNILTIRI